MSRVSSLTCLALAACGSSGGASITLGGTCLANGATCTRSVNATASKLSDS